MDIIVNKIEVHLVDELMYTPGSADNVRKYKTEMCRDKESWHACAVGVVVGDIEAPETSAILLGVGGATSINPNSICYKSNTCFIAVGDSVFALNLPSLKLQWCKKVDFATCFGVYWHAGHNCLITWGEVEVCRLTESGIKIWSASGSDIFTEGFELKKEHIELTDFNKEKYVINYKNGVITNKYT